MNTDNKQILASWPAPELTPRTNQGIALDWLEKQSLNAKYIILELPVGSGKSLVALTLSKFLSRHNQGSSFVLTPQIILQKQYEDDFKEHGKKFLSSLRGKSNYKCQSKGASCAIGSLVKPRCDDCPHAKAKKEARHANNTVLNYALALANFSYTDTFSKRDLMIMDEAHTLERHLVEFDSVNITNKRCEKYKIPFKPMVTIGSAIKWVKETYIPKIELALSELEEDNEYLYEKAGTNITRNEMAILKEIDALGSHVAEVLEMSLRNVEYLKEHFVLVWDKEMFQFKRLRGAYSFTKILKPMANKFLFMSSTILNQTEFCYDLGIDPTETAFISLPSDFPVENRPVQYRPIMKMNASWSKPEQANDRKKMLETISALLEKHDGESGIVHTANFKIAIWLVENLSGNVKHDILHHNPDSNVSRNVAIDNFTTSTRPTILISPSITEGLDLKDEQARFAFIVKTPFGYLGDQWIKKRLEMSQGWYRRRAMTDIIQGCGRIVRSADDYGTVYILDASFSFLYYKSLNMIPQWWKDAYTVVNSTVVEKCLHSS